MRVFLHAVGFYHKNISSLAVLVLEPSGGGENTRFPWRVGQPYLVGFESIRAKSAPSDQVHSTASTTEIYEHPERRAGASTLHVRYPAEHDIFSLGMVLLELGLWRPLERRSEGLRSLKPEVRTSTLEELLDDVAVSAGQTYRCAVAWCLHHFESDEDIVVGFMRDVLTRLEELASVV